MATRLLILALTLLLATGDVALAGAWPREEGEAFVSAQVRQDADTLDDLPVINLYGEYGLTGRWTVGAKLDYALASEDITHVKAFGRWHMQNDGGSWQKAISLSVEGTEEDPYVSPAIHLGRGFDTAFGPGWLDVEVSASVSILDADVDLGGFALVGLKPHPRLMTMMALDVTPINSGTQVNVIPSVAWQYKQGKHLQLEWTHALDGIIKDEVAAGIWLEF
ncbi:hypothetical protein MUY35_08675 [Aliiroseovarius sp. S1339]|uniref:hypothetical protein n=1 Tax=Aliiroseovarius sp. S1339 TaxID=2936990 RepID=UPI0020BD5843|nr:hypothetical protein [Aliiroseovarius sp. S1339]MCK8463920.1 hypothetical protein [Aliiroseovarius sp. S1339]